MSVYWLNWVELKCYSSRINGEFLFVFPLILVIVTRDVIKIDIRGFPFLYTTRLYNIVLQLLTYHRLNNFSYLYLTQD